MFSKGLNITDTFTNKKGPYSAPMGVPASFSCPQSHPAPQVTPQNATATNHERKKSTIGNATLDTIPICLAAIRSYVPSKEGIREDIRFLKLGQNLE